MEITGGSYVVSIPVYEGPMDLLLHLVSKNRIEIHDIPIHEITDQYLDYLNQAQVFNLELGSSFTMAATLLLIKSRTLLPKRRQEEESETEDPRRELERSLEESQADERNPRPISSRSYGKRKCTARKSLLK